MGLEAQENKDCCANCELLREFVPSHNGLPDYSNKRSCCILFTVICDRKNTYEDTVYEIGDINNNLCECFTCKGE